MPSTVIRSFDYDAATGDLAVVFRSGRRYTYKDVFSATFAALQAAFSKGEFFNTHIREQFRFERGEPAARGNQDDE